MRRLADPTRCPGCGTPLSHGSLVCADCGLDLGGPLAQELFATLVHADSLIDRMRRQPASLNVSVAAGPAPGPAVGPMPTAAPPVPPMPSMPSTVVRGSSVPKILLGLGAVCLLVAALV